MNNITYIPLELAASTTLDFDVYCATVGRLETINRIPWKYKANHSQLQRHYKAGNSPREVVETIERILRERAHQPVKQ